MPRVRPCIACGAPLDNDECATPECPYNPAEDTKVHDAEFDYVEGVGENPTDDATFDEGPEMSDEEFAELLNDDYEGEGEDQDPKDPIHSDDLTPEQREQMWEQNQDNKSDKSDKQDDNLDSKINQDAQDADDRMDMGGGDTGDMDTSEVEAEVEAEKEKEKKEKQLTEEDLGEDPSDDALDLPEGGGDEDEEDENLPPRPSGCKGDCKPTDDPGAQDGDPCPHCTAKQFKQEMKAEGKENLPEEKMESEWQDFLDNWQDEAEEAKEHEDFHEREEQMEQMEDQITQEGEGGMGDDDAPEDWEPDLDSDDLPPRPQGCAGNCAENDDPNNDGDPCPHCTAKSFKDEMRQEQEEQEKEFDPEELAERFQEMLQDRREKIEERQEQDRNIDDLLDDDEPEEKPEPESEPEDSEQEPPEDEMGDEHEDESEEDREQNNLREEIIQRVNEARESFDVGVFIEMDAMNDAELTGMFSAEELSDFGDVAENNNAHKQAERLRSLAEPKQEQQEQQDEGFKRKAKDLTVTQEKRFDNIVQRIAKKVEGTFGQTAEEIFTMPKSDGQFQGEDLSQAIQITSRGVIYWVTVSAAKDIDLS